MKELDIVALGGNALLPAGGAGTITEQFAITEAAMEQIAALLDNGRRIVLTHGNGPIVGNIVLRNEVARGSIPPMPLDVCGADSQGGIGYMIARSLRDTLAARGVDKDVVALVTQVRVDADDPAFENPIKPIGPYYTREEADRMGRQRGWRFVEDGSRGYRRVVPSPYPVEIMERDVIRRLVASGTIVIACGGGGIPVVRDGDTLRGCEAVIDKDFTSALLACDLQANRLIIVTQVDAVYTGFGTSDAQPLSTVSLDEIRALSERGEFPPGSMGSKIHAAIEFLESGGESVIICRPDRVTEAVAGRSGTMIHPGVVDGD